MKARTARVTATYQRLRETHGVRTALRLAAACHGLSFEDVCQMLGFTPDLINPGSDGGLAPAERL